MGGLYFRVVVFSVIAALTFGCDDSSDSSTKNLTPDKDPAIAAAESAAIEVLEVHMEARNSLDPDLIAEVNNYPNVRLAINQVQVFDTLEIYRNVEDLYTMPQIVASGWGHSEWDEIEVVQSSENKVHVAVVYSRFDKQDERMLQGLQMYFITKQEDHWGIKVRSAIPDVDLTTDSRRSEAAENAALELLKTYIDARNRRDSESLAALNHYPHMILDGVNLQIHNTPEDYISYEENSVIHNLDYSEWDHSMLDNFKVIQSSPNKVHLAYSCEHLDVVGECADFEEGLWAITNIDNRWAILGRSVF